ncbi:MAG TPA: hypothetical protein VFH48_20420 [Chloroflexota bacterium]|nr:hypothetical protein [Chloroflexota bacterium]
MDFKLEPVMIPASDVDRAKDFDTQTAGFALEVDGPAGEDVVTCPECEQPAAVERRAQLDSTDGPVEHLKIRCLDRHSLFLPAYMLADHPG